MKITGVQTAVRHLDTYSNRKDKKRQTSTETKQVIKRKTRKCNKINGAIKRDLSEQMTTQNKTCT